MKRLAWLLLAVFCTVLVQVQPADALVAKAPGCCQVPGACKMPCCPQPAPLPAVFSLAQSIQVTSSPSRERAQPARVATGMFWASVVKPAAVKGPLPASAEAALAAGVPLFKAHCSFLI
jgi:hypothetical protein